MAVDTITQIRRSLAQQGFTEELVVREGRLCVAKSDKCYAPSGMRVSRVVRLRGITTAEEEGVLFALATADGRPLGTYAPAYHPAMSPQDAAVVRQLHERAISEHEFRAHRRHDHIAAVFDDRQAAQVAVDELRHLGMATDQLGLAVREGDRVFERDAEADVVRDTGIGMAAGAAIGLLTGMTIGVVALVPGGVIGLGGLLAFGLPMGAGGAMIGGYLGEATAERAFFEREELLAVPLEPGQVLVAVCSHGHAGAVEEVLERHDGQLVLRTQEARASSPVTRRFRNGQSERQPS